MVFGSGNQRFDCCPKPGKQCDGHMVASWATIGFDGFPMVFRSEATIGFDCIFWLSTVGQTMQCSLTVAQVYLKPNLSNNELFDRMGKSSNLMSGFARCPDVQILPLLYCCCVPLPRTNLFFYIVPDISNLVIFPMRLCCVVVLLFCSHVFVAFSCVQLPNLAILPTHRCCFERRQEEERDEMRGQSFMRRQKLSPHVGD